MKSIMLIAGIILLLVFSQQKILAQQGNHDKPTYTDVNGQPMLLGKHPKEDLMQMPYREWFEKNYNDYITDTVTAHQIAPLLKNKKFELFMGTWCGDSRREIPRMIKLLENCGVPPANIVIIMVDDHDSTYKQSPGHEEKGKNIFRVPDLIVYEDRVEINRIVEYPVMSLEKDLLAILTKQSYLPSYKAAALLIQQLNNSHPANTSANISTLADLLKGKTESSSELNALGYTWLAAGEKDKALTAFLVNAVLYPTVANVFDSLGEFYAKQGNKEEAKKYYTKVLSLDSTNENAVKMIRQLQ